MVNTRLLLISIFALTIATEADFRLCNISVIGARSSFHRPNTTYAAVPYQWAEWRPRPRKLLQQNSCRAFELDIVWNSSNLNVVNVPLFDSNSTCGTLIDCVAEITLWSCAHPSHEPIFLFVRHSSGDTTIQGAMTKKMWLRVWAEINYAWCSATCRSTVLTDLVSDDDSEIANTDNCKALYVNSHDVRGNASSVAAAVGINGGAAWPTFADARGKLVVGFSREAFSTSPEDAISSSDDVAAFIVDSPVAFRTHSTSAWTGFYRTDFNTDDINQTVNSAAAGIIVIAHPDRYYTPSYAVLNRASVSISLEAMAVAADTDGNLRVSKSEASAFMTACGKRLQHKFVVSMMSMYCTGTQNGCDYRSFASLLGGEIPWLAQAPPTMSEAIVSVTKSVAAGAAIIMSEFPGNAASRHGLGYYVAFENDAAVACRAGSVCTMPSAVELLSIPKVVSYNDDSEDTTLRFPLR